jgi:hypothetical protein
MSFTQSSNDQTTKLILNTQLRTYGTVDHPVWDLQVPLGVPPHHVGLVNVEGFYGFSPNLNASLLTDAANVFSFTLGGIPPVFNYWTNGPGPGLISYQTLFQRWLTVDMSNTLNLAMFLYNFVFNFTDLTMTFPGMNPPPSHQNLTPTLAVVGANVTLSNIPSGGPYTTTTDIITNLASVLSNQGPGNISFILSKNTPANTYAFSGPWLTFLGLSTTTTYTLANPLTCYPAINGHAYINLNANIGRSVLSVNDSKKLVPSDIVWTIPMPLPPGNQIQYTNFNAGGKISFNAPILENIELYFTDELNQPITGMEDWTVILTFDYLPEEQRPGPTTSKRARRTLAIY